MTQAFYQPSRSITRRALRWVIAIVLLALGARLVFTASRLPTAQGALRVFARDATLGWIRLGHRPIDQEDAAAQAEFWLAETDRVFGAHQTYEIARGAAWILDSPGTGFYFRHLRRTSIPGLPLDMDQEAIAAENRKFAEATTPKCLEFAALATKLAPEDKHAWRSRATLLFTLESKPRTSDWRAVLDEASARDPDNALYEYLHANHIWQANAAFADDGSGGAIADPQLLSECLEAFARGQQKTYAPATVADWPVIEKFLKQTSVPRHEHPRILNSRQLQADVNVCELGLLRMQFALLEQQPPEEQLSGLQQSARLGQQVARSGDLSGIGTAISFHQMIAARLGDLLRDHRAALSPSALAQAEQLQTALLRQKLIWETASGRLPQLPQPSLSSWDLFGQYAIKGAAESCVLLAAIALCCWFATRRMRVPDDSLPQKLSVLTHLACWLFSFAIVGMVLGWQAAHVHDLASQQLFTRIVVVAAIVFLLTVAVLVMLYLSGWRFSLRQLLVGPLLLGGCIVLLGSLSLPMLGDLDPAVLQAAAPGFAAGSFNWALVQFSTYAGTTVAILFALLLVGLFALRRAAARSADTTPRGKSLVQRVLAELGRSAAAASLVALALFLLVAPSALEAIETGYDVRMAWLIDLDARRSQFAKEVATIESDAAEMAKIESQVAQQLQAPSP